MRIILTSLFSIVLLSTIIVPAFAAPRTDCNSIVEVHPNPDIDEIQSAIDSSKTGDIICVKPGVYYDAFNIHVPGITVTAYDPTNRPVIDGDIDGSGNGYFELPKEDNPKYEYDAAGRTYNYREQVYISNKDITFSHFVVQNSRGDNIQIFSENNPLTNIHIHHIHAQYAMVTNLNISKKSTNPTLHTGTIIENNLFEYGSQYPRYKINNWPGAVCIKDTHGATFRNNIVRHAWGDGVLIDCNWGKSSNNIIENNIIYDNWSSVIYFHASSGTIFRNNLVFSTPSNPTRDKATIWSCANFQGQENESNKHGAHGISNTKVYNNLFWGCLNNLSFSSQASGSYLDNIQVYNNTFVNTGSTGYKPIDRTFRDVYIATQHSASLGYAKNVRVHNNIFHHAVETGQDPVVIVGKADGITFSKNLWSKKPDNVNVTQDFQGNAQLRGKSGSGDFPVFTRPPTETELKQVVKWFELRNSSPAIDKASPVNFITTDFFWAKRPFGTAPDIGAHEFGSSSGPTNPPSNWDLNQDNTINILDFSLFLKQFRLEYTFPHLFQFVSAI